MKLTYLYVFLAVFTVIGCKTTKPIHEDYSFAIDPGDPSVGGFFVNPKFPGGESILVAARRAFPDHRYLALSRFRMGGDRQYDYAVFFVGRDIKGSFEAIYYRDLVFVKRKRDRDWSNARVFDWPNVPLFDPVNESIGVLEAKGEELGKK